MAQTQETVAAKREIEKLNSVIQATVSRSDAEIDRLRREIAELRKQIGNAAAMRKALEAARDLLLPQCNGGTAFARACGETVNKIMDALAKPPRNCDVGTAGEQYNRFDEFCMRHYKEGNVMKCGQCPFSEPTCKFAWAQMPYTEGGAK